MTNSIYYIANGDGTQSFYNQNTEYIQYDGFTTKITAYAQVDQGETYHLVIAIADGLAAIFDSGIFIAANSLSTGLSTSQKPKQMSLYPNPNTGVFTIDKLSKNEVENIKIIESTGREVSYRVEDNSDSQMTIKLDNPTPGIYWVKLISVNGDFYSSRFLVE